MALSGKVDGIISVSGWRYPGKLMALSGLMGGIIRVSEGHYQCQWMALSGQGDAFSK